MPWRSISVEFEIMIFIYSCGKGNDNDGRGYFDRIINQKIGLLTKGEKDLFL